MAKGFGLKAIVSVSASLMVIMFQLIFIVSLIHSFLVSKSTNFIKSVRYTALATFVCLTVAFIDWIIEECLYRLHPDQNAWIISYWLFFILMAMSLMLFYILMLLRLIYTFKDTSFEISKQITKLHIFIMFIVTIIVPIAVGAKFMNYKWIFYVLLLILMLLYFFGSLHLTYLFTQKLFELTVSMSAMTGKSNDINKPQSFLITIRKHTLLGCIILMMILIDIIIVITYSIKPNYIFWTVGWSSTMSIATLCIYLSFSVNQSRYNFICNRCDIECKIIYDGMTKKKVAIPSQSTLTVRVRSVSVS